MLNKVVLDIETVGFPFESFDSKQQEYLLKFAENETEIEEKKQQLNLYPLTAQVVTIGLFNPDTEKGKILFQSDKEEEFISEDETVHYLSGSEKTILEEFWKIIPQYNQFITFNGRGFDSPFLMIRSAILEIRTSINLVPYRFSTDKHIDLLEQLTFYGATRKFNLDFYCKQFGIDSPKSHGTTGLNINEMFADKAFKEIADYCLGDLRATSLLYKRWLNYIAH